MKTMGTKMNNRTLSLMTLTLVAVIISGVTLVQAGEKAPSTEEQMSGLQTMCNESADARTSRHNAVPLYERLGGYDRILELTTEIVRLHSINPEIKRTLKGVDHDLLAKRVADFMAAGTGGTASYQGRSMPDAHAHLHLTNADFLSAGGDVIKAMQNLKYEQDEIDEVVCILVSLKDQVVLK